MKNLLLALLNAAGIGMILSRSYDLLFNPTLFMDESYYLGGTRAILSGDLFLQTHAFDKPFLLPWWPLAGMLSFGYSPLGMRLVALIVYLLSYVYFQKALNRLSAQPLTNALLTLTLFQLPLFQSTGISAFAEPFIIFCFTMALYFWSGEVALRGTGELPARRTLNWFWAGVFTKYSVILWAPLFLGHWAMVTQGRWIGAARDFLAKLRAAIRRHWGWFAAGLLFSLTNSAKFASITWFSNLAADLHAPAGGLPVAGRFVEWSRMLTSALGFPALVWLLVAAALFVERKHLRKNPVFVGALLASLAHFAVIFGSGRSFYDRYLVIFLPGVFLVLSLLIFRLRSRSLVLSVALPIVLAVWAGSAYSRPKRNIAGPPEFGRLLHIVRQELDRPEMIIHTHYVWHLALFARNAIRSGCVTDDCVRFYREGVKEQAFQFALLERLDGKPVLLRAPTGDLRAAPAKAAAAPAVPDPAALTRMTESVLGSLRMAKWAKVVEVKVLPDAETLRSGTDDLFAQFQPLHSGPRLLIRAEGKGHPIEIEATVAQTDLHEYPHHMNQRRMRPVAVVHRFAIEGRDVTDLAMPLFFGGYVQAL